MRTWSLMYQLEASLGLAKMCSTRDSVDSGVNETMLNRYLLADTAFHMSCEGVDQPRPDCKPEVGFRLVCPVHH